MADLVRDEDTIRRVVARLDTAIDELSRAQKNIVQVDPAALGASARAARTHAQVDRAYGAIQDTLSMLQATHDRFAAQLDQVDRRLAAIDEEAAADALRAQAQVEDATTRSLA